MSSVEVERDATYEPRWNKPTTLFFVAPYILAFAFAYRIYTLVKHDGLGWGDIQAELLGDGIQADMLWITTAVSLLLCGMIALVATVSDALRAKPLWPIAAFSYTTFLFVTVMLTCLSLITLLDWVKANEGVLPLSVQGAIGVFGLLVLLALLILVTRKPISPVMAFYLGAIAVTSFASLASMTMLVGI